MLKDQTLKTTRTSLFPDIHRVVQGFAGPCKGFTPFSKDFPSGDPVFVILGSCWRFWMDFVLSMIDLVALLWY